jgi:hypothetical protein
MKEIAFMDILLNKSFTDCLNKRIRFQAGTIVATNVLRKVATKTYVSSCFSAYRDIGTASHHLQTNCYAHHKDKM